MDYVNKRILEHYIVGKYLSIRTVARRLGISRKKLRSHVYELVEQKKLRKTKPVEVGSGKFKFKFMVYTRV